MTIPITPPGIGVTGVVPSEMERLLALILKGADLGLGQQQVNVEKGKRQDAKDQKAQEQANLAQIGEVARMLLLAQEPQTTLPAGALPGAAGAADVNLGATSPFAQMLQGLPAQIVPQVLPLLQQMGGLQGQAAQTTGQNLQNVERAKGLADDRAIQRIVSGLESQPLTQATIGRVITAVAAIDPQKAQQLAGSLSPLVPNYAAHINPNGTVSWVSNRPGGVAGAPLQADTGDVDQRKAAGYARRVLEANATMTSIEHKFPGLGGHVDDLVRSVRSKGSLGFGIGRAIETLVTPEYIKIKLGDSWFTLKNLGLGTRGVGDAFRTYLNARLDMGNAILRRESGATINPEELDRETTPYVPMLGVSEAVVRDVQQRRLRLGLQYADQAGPAFNADRLTPLARRYLLRAMTGQPIEPEPVRVQRPGETVTPR